MEIINRTLVRGSIPNDPGLPRSGGLRRAVSRTHAKARSSVGRRSRSGRESRGDMGGRIIIPLRPLYASSAPAATVRNLYIFPFTREIYHGPNNLKENNNNNKK